MCAENCNRLHTKFIFNCNQIGTLSFPINNHFIYPLLKSAAVFIYWYRLCIQRLYKDNRYFFVKSDSFMLVYLYFISLGHFIFAETNVLNFVSTRDPNPNTCPKTNPTL